MRAIIVDDEIKSIKLLELILIEYCPEVKITGTATTAMEGVKLVLNKKPELIFLDIEMPNGNGFDMLESIPEKNFEVIFVTAYNHFAIQAIKASAIDYILKPVDIEELVKAVKKAETSIKDNTYLSGKYDILIDNIKLPSPGKLAIPTSSGIEYINIKDIIRIDAERSYCTLFFTGNKKLMVSKSLSDIEGLLKEKPFFRIHKSHLVNLEYVKKFVKLKGHVEMTDGSQVLIARRKKEEFENVMNKFIK